MSSHSHLRAILFALIGYSLWVVCDSTLKLLAATALPKFEILMFLNLGSVVTVTAIALIRGRVKFLRPRKPLLCLSLGLLQLANMFMFLYALQHLPLVNNYIVIFTGPMMTAILAAIFLRERIGKVKALMIVAGFGGVVVALDPLHALAAHGNAKGYMAAFGAISFYTIYVLLLRQHDDENPEAAVLYPRLLCGTLCLLASLIVPFIAITPYELGIVLFGSVCAAIGWMFVTIASQEGPAAIVASYRYSQIITGAFAGYIIWHDVPTLNLVIGALIIVLSGLYMAAHSRRTDAMLESKNT